VVKIQYLFTSEIHKCSVQGLTAAFIPVNALTTFKKCSDFFAITMFSYLDSKLPHAANLNPRNCTKMVWRNNGALFGSSNTSHTLENYYRN